MITYTNEIYLVFFLPLTLLAYEICPKRHRGKVLIAASYVFFYLISKWLFLYLFGVSVFIYLAARLLERARRSGKRYGKIILIFSVLLPVGLLLALKYTNFIGENVTRLGNLLSGGTAVFQPWSILLPIGISFYTLEAVGYLLDVWWGRIPAEKSLEKVLLFLSFFPKLMEGPILRWQDTEATLFSNESLKLENLETGAIRIFWGLLKKIMIADRLAIVVNNLFANYASHQGLVTVLAAVLYTTQLYMEFSGVMDICIGSAKLFGIVLPENFRQPFFAKNVSEFWQRWHISLGAWFKNYIFYPMSTSSLVKKWTKTGRKKFGKGLTRAVTSALCLFPVWMANGIWHGAKWSYIFYGLYYFCIILFETVTEPYWKKGMEKLHINMAAPWYRAGQLVKLLCIVFTGEMFFRAENLHVGVHMFRSIFTGSGMAELKGHLLLNVGIDIDDWNVIIAGLIVVVLYDILKELNVFSLEKLRAMKLPVRWSAYYALIFSVIIFGAYGEGYQAIDLIYAGF